MIVLYGHIIKTLKSIKIQNANKRETPILNTVYHTHRRPISSGEVTLEVNDQGLCLVIEDAAI